MKEDSSVRAIRKPSARLIGLGGWPTAGKDTLADFLVAESHGTMHKFGMSDPLWTMLQAMDPLIPWHADGLGTVRLSVILRGPLAGLSPQDAYVFAKRNPEVRRLLRMLGTEAGRTVIGEDVWAGVAARTFERLAAGPGVRYVFLSGVRHPNEAAMVKSLGGMLLWVHRPGVAEPGEHSSDTSLTEEDFDRVLANDDSVERGARNMARMIVEFYRA